MIQQAIILCGGAGTRLRAMFPDLPKALVPVADRPFLEWQIEWLARAGVRRVTLAAGHRAERLADWRAAYRRRADAAALEIELVVEPRPLGTGGALAYAATKADRGPAFVLNGDSIAPRLDFQALENQWREFSKVWKNVHVNFPNPGKTGAAGFQTLETRGVAMAVTPIENAGRYGTVEFDPDGRVTAFREKAAVTAGWVNAGVYVADDSFWRALPAEMAFSLENDLFPALVASGALLAATCRPPLLDIGTPDGHAAAERALRELTG